MALAARLCGCRMMKVTLVLTSMLAQLAAGGWAAEPTASKVLLLVRLHGF
jgi:hypothetical protein